MATTTTLGERVLAWTGLILSICFVAALAIGS